MNEQEKNLANGTAVPEDPHKEYINALDPSALILSIIMAFLSAVICMQIIAVVGVTPNTSLIGVVFAIIISRIPLQFFKKYRSRQRQNLIQTATSSGGFAAANCGFIAVAILWVMGEPTYIIPMAIGALVGALIANYVIWKIYDSKIFPASGAWPPGVATAAAIEAGDEGGQKGKRLLQGIAVGAVASHFGLPAAGVGIVFIANIFAMTALGIGLVIRGYSEQLFGFNLGTTSIPQGVMIGAGLIALVQSIQVILSKGEKKGMIDSFLDRTETVLDRDKKKDDSKEEPVFQQPIAPPTVNKEAAKKAILFAICLYTVGGLIAALVTGVLFDMSIGHMVGWVLWTGISCVIAMVLVGMAAMQSGWFPAFAITTIFMTLAIFMGFPPLAIAVMTGFISSVGPSFADTGYDLKTGFILRGYGHDPDYERHGRKQQIIIDVFGIIVGLAVVMVFANMFLMQDMMPPISRVFATAIQAGTNPEIMRTLIIWAIPGAIVQFAFGTKSVGVLLATGLLINNPIYGIGVLLAVIVRLIFGKKFMHLRDAGLIAGDGLYGFFRNLIFAFI